MQNHVVYIGELAILLRIFDGTVGRLIAFHGHSWLLALKYSFQLAFIVGYGFGIYLLEAQGTYMPILDSPYFAALEIGRIYAFLSGNCGRLK